MGHLRLQKDGVMLCFVVYSHTLRSSQALYDGGIALQHIKIDIEPGRTPNHIDCNDFILVLLLKVSASTLIIKMILLVKNPQAGKTIGICFSPL